MAVKAGDLELDLIDSLLQSVSARLDTESPAAYREFVRQYYHWVPARDLADRRPEDLAGRDRRPLADRPPPGPGEATVKRLQPGRRNGDGWRSPYTTIEIVSDDMPFIVDSVTMELSRQGYGIELIVHPVMRVVRSADGELEEVLAPGATAFGFQSESIIHVEVVRQSDPDRLTALHAGIELVLEEVRAAVEDWGAMRARTTALATELRRAVAALRRP